MRQTTTHLVLLFTILFVSSGPAVANQHYAVTTSPRVDTPVRTVTFEGESFQIADLGRVDPGASITADVAADSGEAYTVSLYNADGQEIEAFDGIGTDTFSFETRSADGTPHAPGTYVVAVHDNGVQAVAPVVLSGYSVTVGAPSTAESGSTVAIEASVTTIEDQEPIHRVQVVVGDGDDTRRATLTDEGNGDYHGTIDLDSLADGEYALYVVVQGSQRVLGKLEVLGVSDSRSLRVESEAMETTDDPTDGNGGGATTSEVAMPSTTTDGSVITPNSVAPTTATAGQPLGVFPVLAAFIVLVFLARRRRR